MRYEMQVFLLFPDSWAMLNTPQFIRKLLGARSLTPEEGDP